MWFPKLGTFKILSFLLWLCPHGALADAEIFYVLEPFEYTTHLQVWDLEESDQGNLTSIELITDDVYAGQGALRINSAGYRTTRVGHITDVTVEPAHNCLGATDMVLHYMTMQDTNLRLEVVLLDDSECSYPDGCPMEDMEHYVYTFSPGSHNTKAWHEEKIPLDDLSIFKQTNTGRRGNNKLDLGQIRGWFVGYNAVVADSVPSLSVGFDYFACAGGSRLFSAPFYLDTPPRDGTFVIESFEAPNSLVNTNITRAGTSLRVDYQAEKTAFWGGYTKVFFFAPAFGYYNLSDATSISFSHQVYEAASVTGPIHMRLMLHDISATPNMPVRDASQFETYYAFFYILDTVSNLTVETTELRGDVYSTSPFWKPGWSGVNDNEVLDKSLIKQVEFEFSINEAPEDGTVITGSVSIGPLALNSGSIKEASSSMCIQETGLVMKEKGENVRSAAYENDCCARCMSEEDCIAALEDDIGESASRTCKMASFLDSDMLTFADTELQVESNVFIWVNDPEKRGDFCKLCDCREEELTIDCRDKNLRILPATFTTENEWAPTVVDLRSNPQLSFIGKESFSYLPSTVEEVRLPSALSHISFEALSTMPSLKRIEYEDQKRKSQDVMNINTGSSDRYGHVCCDDGSSLSLESGEVYFCELKPDKTGSDAIFKPFTMIFGPDVIDEITEDSPFMAEAAESPEKCATYCLVRDDCFQFNFDRRFVQTRSTCEFMGPPNEGDQIETACCQETDFADKEQRLAGLISGFTPRTRNEFFDAKVKLNPTVLTANRKNDYAAEFEVSLGSDPLRGAVWVTPKVLSTSKLQVKFIPEDVTLTAKRPRAKVVVVVEGAAKLLGRSENLVIYADIESCDAAFSMVNPNDGNIQLTVSNDHVLFWQISGSVCGLTIALVVLYVLFLDRKRKNVGAFWIKSDALVFDNPKIVLGEGAFGPVHLADFGGTKVAVKPLMQARNSPDSASVSELQRLSMLRNSCITSIFGVVSDGHNQAIVMEFIEYGSLRDFFKNKKINVSVELQLNIMRDVGQGLQFLHNANPFVVHGNLKGTNVLINHDLRAKLSDFGFASKKKNGKDAPTFWTAPECLRGDSLITTASDIYSFGVLTYEIFARTDPYDGEEEEAVFRGVADPMVNKRPTIPKGCPIKVALLMSDCLNSDPEHRPGCNEIQERMKRLSSELGSQPSADLHMNTTIVCMDIAGFTSWASARNPSQSVMLLEAVHNEFNRLARKFSVAVVEAAGDTFVFVAGIGASATPDHALVVVKFAQRCVLRMRRLTSVLESSLGPDTADLDLQIGIASGPVTGGTSRGDKARYQVFGATVKTANVLVATGSCGVLHVSQETADLLVQQGKENWVTPRVDKIGHLRTCWVDLDHDEEMETSQGSFKMTDFDEHDTDVDAMRHRRLINWNVGQLEVLLKRIMYVDKGAKMTVLTNEHQHSARRKETNQSVHDKHVLGRKSEPVLSEVCEIITLPEFDPIASQAEKQFDEVDAPSEVIDQLRDFVSCIASCYKLNEFHCFEHASHVVMSVIKLLHRIVAPSDLAEKANTADRIDVTLHDHTYGITSDPLTQFACLLIALVHDTDHPGVPNPQLAKENISLAEKYNGRSIAEQNSFDLTWNLLMEERFADLLKTLCPTQEDLIRFRQLIVNGVMATDISDKEMKALRDARWDKAFGGKHDDSSVRDSVNRKATIVIEHLIQASDVAHTMQHWHIYRTWNERLFKEMYAAYKMGRCSKDPRTFWYKGEIGFFDFYIIPLAKKLKQCGVFGVSSEEYLVFAQQNRKMWEDQGQALVEEMAQRVEREAGSKNKNLSSTMVSL